MTLTFATARDPAAVESILITSVGRFTLDALIDSSQRQQHREEQRRKLLRAQESQQEQPKYSDQAVLANLGWGVDALEEAIQTSNIETKFARLDYAEQMLHVCALLDLGGTTAGVPNEYLRACAHLNLAFVWKLRNDDRSSVMHVLEMFIADPMSSRVEFAPALWETLFQPHLTGIMSWYCDQRAKLACFQSSETSACSWENNSYMEYSYSRDDFSCDEAGPGHVSCLAKVTPEQTAQLQILEKLYENSLDDHTRQYARYYKDWLTFRLDPASQRKAGPLMPIAEPPATPLSRILSEEVQHKPQLEIIHEVEIEEDKCDKLVDESKKTSKNLQSVERPVDLTMARSTKAGERNREEIGRSREISGASTDEPVRPKRPASSSSSSSFSTSEELSKHINTKLSQVSRLSSFGKNGFTKQLLEKVCNYSASVSSPRDGSPRSASSSRHGSPRSMKKPKSLERKTSKLSDILQEDNVPASAISSPSKYSAASSESELEMKEKSRTRISQEVLHSPATSSVTTPKLDFDRIPYSKQKIKSPKDFVCPITNQLFDDPVTLETGQTYERTAILEWLERGNTTCPITRQPLRSKSLPRTNYVLKRLIENWRELNPSASFTESPLVEAMLSESYQQERDENLMPSPSSVISTSSSSKVQKPGQFNDGLWAFEDLFSELKAPVECLCTSENLQECEEAVMTIAEIWEQSGGDYRVEAGLSKATVIEGLIEVLTVSVSSKVQNAAVCILSALIVSDEFTRHTILRADPELESLRRVLRSKVGQAAVLLYHLKLSSNELNGLNLLEDLVNIVKCELGSDAGDEGCGLSPKAAAILLLHQLVSVAPERSRSNAHLVLQLEALPLLVENISTRDLDERLSTISILVCCMKADGRCRSSIARCPHLASAVDLLIEGSGAARRLVAQFFLELAHSNRIRSNQVLRTVSSEGIASTRHALLVSLQKASPEQKHIIAVLLLQLEIVNQPRQYSVYIDESVQAITSALSTHSFDSQLETIESLVALVGRFSHSGAPMTEACLLKGAGQEQAYDAFMKESQPGLDQQQQAEEEKAARLWELDVAMVLLEYDGGAILEAIGTLLQYKSVELTKPSMIMAVWLCKMVKQLPDIGARPLARRFFMAPFIIALESSKSIQHRVLAALGLHTFLSDAESFQELLYYAKDIIKPLRQLKRVTWIAQEFIEAFVKSSSTNPMDLWQHSEIGLLDTSRNGEVKALARCKGRFFSGHSDGTIQVWETKKKVPTLVVMLKEHAKAVTSLTIPPSSNKLYSGSLDKTIRVWSIAPDSIHCTNVYDINEAVYGMAIAGSAICINTQGSGIRIQTENLQSKQINLGRHVQCIASSNGNIYCGCTDHSIQEVDVEEGSVVTIQPPMRTLLGKKPVYAIAVYKTEVYTAGPAVEGGAVKIWDQTDYTLKRVLPVSQEIRAIAVNDDFLYFGSTSGCVEVWLRERSIRVSLVSAGSRVHALCLDGDLLYSGSDDGKIRVISFS